MPVRKQVPTIAWLLSGGTAVALLAVTVPGLLAHGQSWFFHEGDAYLYRATAQDLFGHGRSFAVVGRLSEVPYRYGRGGLPFLAWVLAFGRPGLVAWPLIAIQLGSIAAIPGLAATMLDDYGAPAIGGAAVLLAPGLLLIYNKVYADALLIALILLAYLLEARGKRKRALGVLAFAVLVKEVGALALVPWLWRAGRDRDARRFAMIASALVPYAGWCLWLRWRVGALPFLAHTDSRSGALRFPGIGIYDAVVARSPDYQVIVLVVLATLALGVAGAWCARRFPIGGLAASYAVLTACLGPLALKYEGEALRVLAAPQVFALICVTLARTRHLVDEVEPLSAANADL